MLGLKYAFRSLARTPGFTAVTLLTVALAVGANTAIFSIVHGVLIRPLAFREADRLVTLWELVPDDAGVPRRWRTTAGNYFDWEAEATAFENMALFASAGLNWTGEGEPEELLGARSGDVVLMVVHQGMRLTLAGLAIGLASALGSTPVLRRLLFGVGPTDPWTFAFVAAFLASVALLASYVPARRASRIEPLIALRHE